MRRDRRRRLLPVRARLLGAPAASCRSSASTPRSTARWSRARSASPSQPWLHYHLSGTTDKGRETGSSTLVLLEAARWAQANGYERFHLGGGLGGKADSLHHFKARFDPEGLVEAAVGKAIHDEDAYRELSGGEARLRRLLPCLSPPERVASWP